MNLKETNDLIRTCVIDLEDEGYPRSVICKIIHGDSTNNTISIKNLYQVVIDGVIEKGMIPYKDQLSPVQIQQVLSYILTLQGTNPPNPKAPQGPKYEKIS